MMLAAPHKKRNCCVTSHPFRIARVIYRTQLAEAKVSETWRTVMPRNDVLQSSAPRVELDQRSREARLRLEHVERLLIVRPLPRQSFLRRVLRRLGFRIY